MMYVNFHFCCIEKVDASVESSFKTFHELVTKVPSPNLVFKSSRIIYNEFWSSGSFLIENQNLIYLEGTRSEVEMTSFGSGKPQHEKCSRSLGDFWCC